MRITIICEDKDVEIVRQISTSFIKSHVSMTKPVSQTGQYPQTHWMCVCEVSLEAYKELKETSKYSKIMTGNPKVILNELNLKRIKNEK
jgi:hypothetical protein